MGVKKVKEQELNIQIYVACPAQIEEKYVIASEASCQALVLNVEKLQEENKKEMLDFMAGAMYSRNIKIREITKDIVLYEP